MRPNCFSLLCIAGLAFNLTVRAGNYDSLITALSHSKEDTHKVVLLLKLNMLFQNNKTDSAFFYSEQALALSEKLHFKRGIANSMNDIGLVHSYRGDLSKALDYYLKSLNIAEEAGEINFASIISSNIGVIYFSNGDIALALKYLEKSLDLIRNSGELQTISKTMNNLGALYYKQGNMEKALHNYKESLHLKEKLKDTTGIGYSYNNIAFIFDKKGDKKNALKYYLMSLVIRRKIGDKMNESAVMNNIGSVYLEENKFDSALYYFQRSMELGEAGGFLLPLKESYNYLFKTSEKKGNHKNAIHYLKKFMAIKDSIFNEEKSREIGKLEAGHEFDKKLLEQQKENEKQMVLAEAEKSRQRLLIISVTAGLVLALGFVFFIFNRLKITRRQKAIIENQKQEVDQKNQDLEQANHEITEQKEIITEKNKEIIDSITYAKGLQQAILPQEKHLGEPFEEYFILYKPKDIVAGDFYFFEQKKNHFILAAADCTGHGVPGAMVSVVCSNALTRSVKEFGLTDPGRILDKTSELVIETFEKSESVVKDGMDLSCISFDKSLNKLQWSGANNPLWYIYRNEFFEITADKKPIGVSDLSSPFTTHEIPFEKGMVLYLFTDGYADQFGGPKGKKFKYKPLKELIFSNHTKPLAEQKAILDEAIEKWKGDLEQVDDVTIVGVRV